MVHERVDLHDGNAGRRVSCDVAAWMGEARQRDGIDPWTFTTPCGAGQSHCGRIFPADTTTNASQDRPVSIHGRNSGSDIFPVGGFQMTRHGPMPSGPRVP